MPSWQQSQGGARRAAGFVLALLMERCYFVDFPFFNDYFEHELDFSWARHEQRLMAHGHNLTDPANAPMAMPFGYTIIADMWMFTDLKEKHAGSYGVEMVRDLDYSAALIQANPHHRVRLGAAAPHRAGLMIGSCVGSGPPQASCRVPATNSTS